jgi:GNAT superfamily N-acetyltransferase
MDLENLTIRRATPDDLPRIVAMLADDYLGRLREALSEPLDERYGRAFAAIDADPNQFLAVAELDDEVVGCLQLTFIPGLSRIGQWRGLVEAVRVDARFRGRGIGRRMLQWAIDECRTRGCSFVQLTTDKSRSDAHRFYASLGFEATHEGFKLAL